MRLLTRAAAVAPAVVVMMTLSAHAFAAPNYPPSVPDSITVSSTSASSGDSITVSAKTFRADSDVDVTTALETTTAGDAALHSLGGGGRFGTVLRAAASGECATGRTCTVVASSSGVATARVALTAVGPTVITLSGVDPQGQQLQQTVMVEVVPEGAGAMDPQVSGLAATGPANLFQAVGVAIVLLGVGAFLVLLVRRRRDSFANFV